MAFGLLWIEVAAVSCLWLACLLTFIANVKNHRLFLVLRAFAAAVPFVILGVPVLRIAIVKFYASEWNEDRLWFNFLLWYAFSLLIVYALGTVLILWRGSLRQKAGLSRNAAAWPRRRLGLALLLGLLVSSMTFWNMDLAAKAQMVQQRAEVDRMMLSFAPPPTHDAQKAARLYKKAFAHLGLRANNEFDPIDVNDPAVNKYLAQRSGIISLLLRAAALPDCRFEPDNQNGDEYDWWEAGLEVSDNMCRAAALLEKHARFEIAHGRADSALADAKAIYAEYQHVQSISPQRSLMHLFSNLLPEVLNVVTRPEQLAGLEDLRGQDIRRDLQRYLIESYASNLHWWDWGDKVQQEPSYSYKAWLPFHGMLFRVFVLADLMADSYRTLQQQEKLAQEPFYTVKQKYSELVKTTSANEVAWWIYQIFAEAEARQELAHLGVAMTHYRLDHGALPETLEALVPQYLDAVPTDPFDGKPLRLVLKGNQRVIYSVGPKGLDYQDTPIDRNGHGNITFALTAPAAGGR